MRRHVSGVDTVVKYEKKRKNKKEEEKKAKSVKIAKKEVKRDYRRLDLPSEDIETVSVVSSYENEGVIGDSELLEMAQSRGNSVVEFE